MQIRSAPGNYRYLPSPEYRRDRAGDAPAVAAVGGDAGEQGGRSRGVTRVQRSPAADDNLAGLAPQVRGALQSYLSNGPTLSERYGVELAGVDIFV